MLEAARVKSRLLEEVAMEAELVRAADSPTLAVVEAAIAKAHGMGMTVRARRGSHAHCQLCVCTHA